MQREVVVSTVCIAIGTFSGSLKKIASTELAAQVGARRCRVSSRVATTRATKRLAVWPIPAQGHVPPACGGHSRESRQLGSFTLFDTSREPLTGRWASWLHAG